MCAYMVVQSKTKDSYQAVTEFKKTVETSELFKTELLFLQGREKNGERTKNRNTKSKIRAKL